MSSKNTNTDGPHVAVRNYESDEYDSVQVITIMLEGLSKDDINITNNDTELIVQAGNQFNKSFTQRFDTPSGADTENTEAKFYNGVLTITIPVTQSSPTEIM